MKHPGLLFRTSEYFGPPLQGTETSCTNTQIVKRINQFRMWKWLVHLNPKRYLIHKRELPVGHQFVLIDKQAPIRTVDKQEYAWASLTEWRDYQNRD